MSKVLVSIITVVYNDALALTKTINNLKKQTISRDLFEYVVIDGASNDQTLNVAHQNKNFIDVLLSENDHGIYDAMNKGAEIAKGKWLYFLNAGDELFSDDILICLVDDFKRSDINFIYGDYIQILDTYLIKKSPPIKIVFDKHPSLKSRF